MSKKNRYRDYVPPPLTEETALEGAILELQRFEKPALNILRQIRPQLERQDYDCILSDDSSARVHSLVLGQAIQDIYGPDKRLRIVFVQGGRLLKEQSVRDPRILSEADFRRHPYLKRLHGTPHLRAATEADIDEPESHYVWQQNTTHADEVRAYLKRMAPLLNKRVLVVTEEINSGASLDILTDMLLDMGVRSEVACFGTTVTEDDCLTTEEISAMDVSRNGTRWFFGNKFDTSPSLESNSLGIYESGRSGIGAPVYRPYPDSESYSRLRTQHEYRLNLIAIRDAAKQLGHKLADQYFETET